MAPRWRQKSMEHLRLMLIHFEFLAIAFGRIGGQNIGVKLTEETENKLKALEYNIDEVIDELQKKLISGNLSVPDGLKRESFADD